jgi:hypothetical protein
MTYDYAIIGGGIAGIATAEIFARSGFNVVLAEKNNKLCKESSGKHHEWFHFGSLYSMLSNKDALRILVGGIDDLMLYYRDFKNMNLKVNRSGTLTIISKKKSWFKNSNFKYLFALKNNSKTWSKKCEEFFATHRNFKNYDWRKGESSNYIPYIKNKNKQRIHKYKKIKNFFYKEIDSLDCPMDSTLIIHDLLKNFINYKGKIKTNFNLLNVKNKNKYKILIGEKNIKIKAKKIIFANGSGVNKFVRKEIVKSYISPLLIAYPNLLEKNYIIMHEKKSRGINHVVHSVGGVKYSIIGGAEFAEYDEKNINVKHLYKNLIQLAKNTFGEKKKYKRHLYFGIKNEVINKAKRNYIYTIKEVEKGVYYINPGKFSLSFSLAINTYKKIIGHYPNPSIETNKINKNFEKYIEGNYHKNYILENFL